MNDPADKSTPISTRTLAHLARAGYHNVRDRFMQVDYEVHHIRDQPGYLEAIVAPAASRDGSEKNAKALTVDVHTLREKMGSFVETISSNANGIGLVVGTRTARQGAELYKPHGASESSLYSRSIGKLQGRIFFGSARPSLVVSHESSHVLEGIVSIAQNAGPPTLRHGLAIRELLSELSELAAVHAVAPLLSVQCPVQVPPQADTSIDLARRQEEPPPCSSLAVRFSIGLRGPSAALRLQLAEELAKYCRQRGFGLWLADNRLGHRTGNWYLILKESQSGSSLGVSRWSTSADDPIKVCAPVTFVGPARVGSTRAILRAISQFQKVGILACSITSLDDLAFIHFQLVAGGPQRRLLRALNSALGEIDDDHRTMHQTLVDALAVLEPPRRASDRELEAELARRAGDYQILLGPALPLAVEGIDRRIALWISWRAHVSGASVATPILGIAEALREMGLWTPEMVAADCPNIEYLVCRQLDNFLRGKGKVSLVASVARQQFVDTPLESWIAKLCVALEETWKGIVGEPSSSGVSELTVSWRECWLGHWTSPL